VTPDPSDQIASTWHFGPKHILFGVLCLCLGATQFSSRLRQRHARVHRVRLDRVST